MEQAEGEGASQGGADYQGANASQIEAMREREEKQKEMEERRNIILSQILEPDAKDRLSRLGLVKPEKARQVENSLIQMAQSGRLGGRVGEEMLKTMLQDYNERTGKEMKVKIMRRKGFDSDEELSEEEELPRKRRGNSSDSDSDF